MKPDNVVHTIIIICHTVVLLALIVASVILASENRLTASTIGFLATLGGITSGGLVINGRKTGTKDDRSGP